MAFIQKSKPGFRVHTRFITNARRTTALEEKKVNDGTINRQSLPETYEKDDDWEER